MMREFNMEELDELHSPGECQDGMIIKITETEKLPVSCSSVIDATNYDTALDLMLYKLIASAYLLSDDYASIGVNVYGSMWILELRSNSFPSKEDMQLCFSMLKQGSLHACHNHPQIAAALDEIQQKIETGEIVFEA